MPSNQVTNSVLIRNLPDNFVYNPAGREQSQKTNSFNVDSGTKDIVPGIREEMNVLAGALQEYGVEVKEISGSIDSRASIFPNNILSMHADGPKGDIAFKYPLNADKRNDEFTPLIDAYLNENYADVRDWREDRNSGLFLEGTGSMVLDREHKIVYAALSPRTNEALVQKWAEMMNYEAITFETHDYKDKPIYHTNVIMSIGETFSLITPDIIKGQKNRDRVVSSLKSMGRDIAEISPAQMMEYCGNILEVEGHHGSGILVMSERARKNFTNNQIAQLNNHVNDIVDLPLENTEKIGGSARCCIAENFKSPAPMF